MKSLLYKIRQLNLSGKSNEGSDSDVTTEVRNWYSDRYTILLVQRNILCLFVIMAIAAIIGSILVIGKISLSKTVEPFVIEIENKSGITNIVNPLAKTEISANEALNTYFVMQYIRSRETYNILTYEYNYKTIVRLLSASKVYGEFLAYINSASTNPISKYGANNSTHIKLRSVQYLDSEKTVQVRFTVIEEMGSKKQYYKIATLKFDYQVLELTADERQVNPLGFQILSYRVDDEVLS